MGNEFVPSPSHLSMGEPAWAAGAVVDVPPRRRHRCLEPGGRARSPSAPPETFATRLRTVRWIVDANGALGERALPPRRSAISSARIDSKRRGGSLAPRLRWLLRSPAHKPTIRQSDGVISVQ